MIFVARRTPGPAEPARTNTACRAPDPRVECLAQSVAPRGGGRDLPEVSCFIWPWLFLFSCKRGLRPPAATPTPAKGTKTDAPADKDKDAKEKEKKEVVEEKPVTTQHELRLPGRVLKYSVTTGLMPLKNEAGEIEAQVFFMAYVADRPGGPEKRPLTISFNGGPGSSSVWLHLGALGPKRVKMLDDGGMPAASLHARGQRAHLARPHRPGVHRPGGHGLQPRQQARAGQEVLGPAGRHRVGGGVHPPVPDSLRALGLAPVHGRRELRHHARGRPLGLPRRAAASPSTASCSCPRS